MYMTLLDVWRRIRAFALDLERHPSVESVWVDGQDLAASDFSDKVIRALRRHELNARFDPPECPVCMEPMGRPFLTDDGRPSDPQRTVLRCGHAFHAECLRGVGRCPICRRNADRASYVDVPRNLVMHVVSSESIEDFVNKGLARVASAAAAPSKPRLHVERGLPKKGVLMHTALVLSNSTIPDHQFKRVAVFVKNTMRYVDSTTHALYAGPTASELNRCVIS
jgi:hypothetical protein